MTQSELIVELAPGAEEKSMTENAQRMWDANVRIERLFWIGGICAEACPDFLDFINDDLLDAKELLGALPWLRGCAESDGPMSDIERIDMAEHILSTFAQKGIDGFIAQLATPVPRDVRKDGSHTFSWGYYATRWIFADDLEQICANAELFRDETLESASVKQKKGD